MVFVKSWPGIWGIFVVIVKCWPGIWGILWCLSRAGPDLVHLVELLLQQPLLLRAELLLLLAYGVFCGIEGVLTWYMGYFVVLREY